MSDPEPDYAFRERLLRVVSEDDRPRVVIATGSVLDMIGRQYDRFRTGVPLQGLEKRGTEGGGHEPCRAHHYGCAADRLDRDWPSRDRLRHPARRRLLRPGRRPDGPQRLAAAAAPAPPR